MSSERKGTKTAGSSSRFFSPGLERKNDGRKGKLNEGKCQEEETSKQQPGKISSLSLRLASPPDEGEASVIYAPKGEKTEQFSG